MTHERIRGLLDAIEGGDHSVATWRALLDALLGDEAIEDEHAVALIRQHARAIPGSDLAYGLVRVVAERSMDGATATYALTSFLRRGDVPAERVDGALWSLVWLTACERSDTGAIEDLLGSMAGTARAERFSQLHRALDVALGGSDVGVRLQGEARDQLRAVGLASLLADAARHLASWQQRDVAAALRRAGVEA